MESEGSGFRLVERAAEPPVVKTFPLDLGRGREWETVWLALEGGRAVGVVATQYEAWNKRAVIWHLYVCPGHRRRGIGSRLLAYEHLGFRLCGLDTSLYDGTPAEGEVALFLCRSLVDDVPLGPAGP